MNFDDLKSFQQKGATFLSNRPQAVLCDEMRMGKSAQAIVAADMLKLKRILVLCPASVKIVWQREFSKWSELDRPVQIISGRNAVIADDIAVTIMNYDICTDEANYISLTNMEFDLIIIDEFHYLKGMESQRTEAVLLNGGIASRAKRHWGLSGTPILNRPIEIFPITQALAPECIAPYNGYKTFAQHFCGGYYDTASLKFFDGGATNKAELNNMLNSGFMLRRLRKDHLDELPKDHQLVPVEIDTAEVRDLIAQEFKWDKSEAQRQALSGEDPIATVRRLLAVSKIPHMLRHIKYLLTTEAKIVVGGYTKEVMKTLYRELAKFQPAAIGGGMSPKKKQENSDRFRDDPACRVMLGQIYSAAEGQDFCSAKVILFVEIDWVPGKLDQFGDRCSGFNQSEAVLVQYLVYKDSLDEHQLRIVIDKKETITECIEDEDDFSYIFG